MSLKGWPGLSVRRGQKSTACSWYAGVNIIVYSLPLRQEKVKEKEK